MRAFLLGSLLCAGANAFGQTAAVAGEVVLREGGMRLGLTTIVVVSEGRQLLAGETGRFLIAGLKPGDVRLRFKRIGFVPKDTTLRVAGGDTARVRIEMTRLVIQLPVMLVTGRCTNESPLQPMPGVLAELFEQVTQNAERVRLLAKQKPFVTRVARTRGWRDGEKIESALVDTITRGPLPHMPYEPKRVIRRGEGLEADGWVLALPELPDLADTAFTNNHCFRHGGQLRLGEDSVVKVDFEPIPRLNRETDIKGSLFLKVDGYRLVESVIELNRIPGQLVGSGLTKVSVRAKFAELVPDVPVLVEWDFTSRYWNRAPGVELGRLIDIQWADGAPVRPDTVARRR